LVDSDAYFDGKFLKREFLGGFLGKEDMLLRVEYKVVFGVELRGFLRLSFRLEFLVVEEFFVKRPGTNDPGMRQLGKG
jgi:hypothetical protein